MSHHVWGIFLTLWCPGCKSNPLTEIKGGREETEKDIRKTPLVLLLTLNRFQTFVRSFYFLLRTVNAAELGPSQPAFTCSKLTIETLEQGVKYVQSYQ